MPVVRPLAVELVQIINNLSVAFTAGGSAQTATVRGYLWDQSQFDRLPGAMVRLPTIGRAGVDEAESQIGTRDYLISFPVDFVVDLSNVEYTQELALAAVEAFIDAIDSSEPPLDDNTVIDAKVTDVERPVIVTEGNRPLLVYPTTVELLKLA